MLSDINEARIIRGVFEENGIYIKIYENISELFGEKSNIVFIDIKCLDEKEISKFHFEKLSDTPIIFIVPFWMKFNSTTARELARKLGFRTGKYIKRPFTAYDLVEYCKKLTENTS